MRHLLYHDWLAFIVLLFVMLYSVAAGKLSMPAALTGGVIGVCVFKGAGYNGLLMLGLFFISGVIVTSWRKERKTRGTGDIHPQRRTIAQVLANGGMAAVAGVMACADAPNAVLYRLALAASLASATADTWSSELGMVYGRRFYNVLSWKKEPKGLDGAISLEGTLIGMAGACMIAVVYGVDYQFDKYFLIIIFAGILGNLADSLLGAAWERKGHLGNNMVNLLNTLFAALAAIVLAACLNK